MEVKLEVKGSRKSDKFEKGIFDEIFIREKILFLFLIS
jgi:hypothetical protein